MVGGSNVTCFRIGLGRGFFEKGSGSSRSYIAWAVLTSMPISSSEHDACTSLFVRCLTGKLMVVFSAVMSGAEIPSVLQ